MRNRTLRQQLGFTFAEMLIMVFLVGMLTLISIPSFRQARRYADVTRTANGLFIPLNRARNLAMRKQRPVLIIMQTAATGLTFTARLDNNFSTVPGYDGGGAGDTLLTPLENPFGLSGQLIVSPYLNQAGAASNNFTFSFGYPSAASGFSAGMTNLLTPAAGATCAGVTCWFGFDASGKLIPNGQKPFAAALDITNQVHQPAGLVGINNGGPEFYFTEFGSNTNTRPNTHVFRKVEITPIGSIRIQSWFARGVPAEWRGIQ